MIERRRFFDLRYGSSGHTDRVVLIEDFTVEEEFHQFWNGDEASAK